MIRFFSPLTPDVVQAPSCARFLAPSGRCRYPRFLRIMLSSWLAWPRSSTAFLRCTCRFWPIWFPRVRARTLAVKGSAPSRSGRCSRTADPWCFCRRDPPAPGHRPELGLGPVRAETGCQLDFAAPCSQAHLLRLLRCWSYGTSAAVHHALVPTRRPLVKPCTRCGTATPVAPWSSSGTTCATATPWQSVAVLKNQGSS